MISRRKLIGSMLAGLGSSLVGREIAYGQPPNKKAGGHQGMHAYDEIMESVLSAHGIVGGTLAIAKDGRLALAKGYGLADEDARRPVTPRTLFCVASVTKAVTAVAALRLVDQGRLQLDARLVDVIADIRPPGGRFADPNFERITLRQVLFHGSGIPNRVHAGKQGGKAAKSGDDEDEGGEEGEGSEKAVEQLRAAMAGPLDFVPGSTHKYSNSGYLIARLFVERASGQSYVPFVEQEVFRPMGIRRATMEKLEPIAGETSRYVRTPNGHKPAARSPVNWLFTPTELVLFLTALTGSRVKPFLSREVYHAMVAPPPRRSGRSAASRTWAWDGMPWSIPPTAPGSPRTAASRASAPGHSIDPTASRGPS